jgi:hypothetical protein
MKQERGGGMVPLQVITSDSLNTNTFAASIDTAINLDNHQL